MNLPHTLSGTFHVDNAEEAERRAHEAARDYFGDVPVIVNITVSERRDIGDRVRHYEVDYYAAPDPDHGSGAVGRAQAVPALSEQE